MERLWRPWKDPDEARDYGIEWRGDIGAATIVSSTWTAVAGSVEIDGQSHDADRTWLRISGGAAGETCRLKNSVVLDNGEHAELTCILRIRHR